MGIQARTLRKLSPLSRELAKAINDADNVKRSLRKLQKKVELAEHLANVMLNRHPEEIIFLADTFKALRGRLPRNNGRFSVEEMLERERSLDPESRERAQAIDDRRTTEPDSEPEPFLADEIK